MFDCCWPNQIAIKALSSGTMVSGSSDSRGGTNIKALSSGAMVSVSSDSRGGTNIKRTLHKVVCT